MIYQFPDQNTLQLALTSGAISAEAAVSSAKVAMAEDGSVWVDSQIKLSKESRSQLKAWNVVGRRSPAKAGTEFKSVGSWLQIIPVQRETGFLQTGEKTPVLFELPDESTLPEFVNEILRQGNDRQSFRTVGSKGHQITLLRVLGPPYYSLLRALENPAADGAIKAYVERSPRVWIQVGFQHVMATAIKPAAGQHLLLEAPSTWRALKEQPFRDIYDVLEFRLPDDSTALADSPSDKKLQVPIRIVRGGADDAAELFVIRKDSIRQLDQFVQSSSDQILDRLSFAVSQAETKTDEPIVIVRIRPGRSKPPTLVFDGLICRRYLKIPNLFVPVGRRIHPPLRREAIKTMLADDETQIVWVEPVTTDDSTVPAATTADSFHTFRINDTAFRPLSEWVDYIIDRDVETMTAWKASHQFDFEDFVCKDDKPKAQKKKKPTKKKDAKSSSPGTKAKQAAEDEAEPTQKSRPVKKFQKPGKKATATDSQRAEYVQQLRQLENEFRELEAPLDDPLREPMWSQMAQVNVALDQYSDASICHQHELWEQSGEDVSPFESWYQTEVNAARHFKTDVLPNDKNVVDAGRLTSILKQKSTSPIQTAQVVSFVAAGCRSELDAAIIKANLAAVQAYLEKYESFVSTRACWLAWHSLATMTGDVLTLARARDRILERLYQQGLIPDRDLPGFLRTSTSQAGERFQKIRSKVAELHQVVRDWSANNLSVASPHTVDYVDLIFAFAFAKLGETTLSRKTMLEARERLRRKNDSVHGWLYDAFEFRIEQASSGQTVTGAYPDELVELLETIPKLERYKVDRLRQHSSILEPHEQLDPYRNWRRRNANDLQHELSELFDEFERKKLLDRLKKLFKRKLNADDKARLITTALELSTRIGEDFAVKMLAKVVPADHEISDTLLRADLLEKGLHISAHYDQAEFAQACLERMHQLIDAQKTADDATLAALESLLSRSFAGLRKLGMREQIAAILDRMTAQVRPANLKKIEPERMRVLLQLAGGWFYFGQDRGWKDIDLARKTLLGKKLISEGHVGAKKQTDLAVAYIQAVGQAPLEDAIARLNELFERLAGIHDSATVNSHFSLKQLDIVDALVQTIVSDSFTMNKESQRWLDDEEFLIRRRIHSDVRRMMPS